MAAGAAAWTEEQQERQNWQSFTESLMKSQRDQAVSTFGEDLSAIPDPRTPGDELANLRNERAKQREEIKSSRRAVTAGETAGVPLATVQPIPEGLAPRAWRRVKRN